MNVLWVFTHPEQRSLLGALCADGRRALEAAGHDVRLSDLYAMKWKTTVDPRGTVSREVEAEREKLGWADTVVIQFPLWWYRVPAILMRWFDRVFGYRVPDAAGKRALVVVNSGSTAELNGPTEHALYPLLHGILGRAGMAVLPPVITFEWGAAPEETYRSARAALLTALGSITETPYGYQRTGDLAPGVDTHLAS